MLRTVVAAIILCSGFSTQAAGQESALDKTLMQPVTVHFREISVAGIMDFLASHGINVAARTSDINLREQIALNVTGETMHDVMQAIAGSLGAQWKRSGHIFILSRVAPTKPNWHLSGPFRHHSMVSAPDETDPEAAFAAAEETPSAVVSDELESTVGTHTASSTKKSSLLRLSPSGDWVVAGQWSSSSKIFAHALNPKLSIRQRRLLAKFGSLSLGDLTPKQLSSLGEVWPDGKYHVVSNGHTLLIKK